MKIYNLKTKQEGQTLVELLVALATFSIFIATICGLFVSGIQAQARVLATQEVINQTSYVLDYMSRALRMAVKDTDGTCLTAPQGGDDNGAGHNYEYELNRIRFLRYNAGLDKNICQEFYLFLDDRGTPSDTTDDISILKEKKSSDKKENNFGAGTDLLLTSYNINVNSFQVNVSGDNRGDEIQPRVTIFLEVAGRRTSLGSPVINVQTSISQRNLDGGG